MVPRPTNAPRAFAPRETRSAQGIAATGRYAESPGAIKIYSDPYANMYSSMADLDAEPVQAQPQKSTQAVDQAVDDSGNYAPGNVDKEAMVDPETQRQTIDTVKGLVSNHATNAAMQGGIVGTAVGAAGYGSNAAIGAGLGAAGNALVNVGSLTSPVGLATMGIPLADTWAPRGWAALERSFALDNLAEDHPGVTVNEDGSITMTDLTEDQALAVGKKYYDIQDTHARHSRPLHTQIGELISPVTDPIIGWLDDNLVQPVKGWFGFDDEPEMTPEAKQARAELNAAVDDMMKDQVAPAEVEGIDEAALDDRTPDFAESDYDYNPMMSHEQNMEAMKTQENRQKEEKKQEDKAKAAAAQTKTTSRHKTSYHASGVGFKGSSSGGWNGGVRDATVSRDYSGNSNPGGFSRASGGNAGGGFGGGGMSNGRGRN